MVQAKVLGRTRERAAIDELLEQARGGAGGCLVLHGEPGIGKTTLLSYAASQAHGLRVLRTSGVEPESDLGYAALHRLLLPLLDRVDRLPAPLAAGLGVVFGRATGEAPDRFLVSLAALSLLSDAADDGPLLCLIDDAQWVDTPSLDTLAFVARRLSEEPIAVAMAARADEGQGVQVAGLVELPLAGLDRDAVRQLLAEGGRDGLPPGELDELLRATGGNPLALRELPAAPVSGAREPVPLATGLRQAFLDRVRQRDPASQQVLLLAAVDGSGRTETIRKAAASLGTDAEALTDGTLDDLLAVDGATLAFRHPLIRSAVFHGASGASRRAAHRSLAEALLGAEADLDRRAWHLGQAADGADEEAASELERSAAQALRRAGPAAAAAALVRSSELSVSVPDRTRRQVAAATAWWQAGYATRATSLLDKADPAQLADDGGRLDALATRALIDLRAGRPADVLALLMPVLPDVVRADQRQLFQLLMVIGEAAYTANAAGTWQAMLAIVEQLTLTGTEPDDVLARLFRAACRLRSGAPPGLEPGDLETIEQLTDPARLGWACGMAWGIGDRALARRLMHKAERLARDSGAAGTLAWVLDYIVSEELARGRFSGAESYAEEGFRFAVESGQPNTACRHQSSLAVVAAWTGREAEVERLAGQVLAEARRRGLSSSAAQAYRALGLSDLAAGRPAEALEHFEVMAGDPRTTHPGIVLQTVPEVVEAAVWSGEAARAASRFGAFETWAESVQEPGLLAQAARCRALLASDASETDAAFQQALELHERAEQPMEQARTGLAYGSHLRRTRRRSEARAHLRTAVETFRALGASAWAERAASELRATGETAAKRTDGADALLELTPQERRIATAVGEGATNKEIAAQLFLSPRTVDYHLRKVFQKLGISSRTELVKLSVRQ